jgi:hypothetical protein
VTKGFLCQIDQWHSTTTNDLHHLRPVLQRVCWAIRASALRRSTATARGPQRDLLWRLLSFLYLPLPFFCLHPTCYPTGQAYSTTVQLLISCNPRNYGIILRNTCIATSAPNTLSFHCTTLTTCLAVPPHRDSAAFTRYARPSSPPATVFFGVDSCATQTWRVLVTVLQVRLSIRPSVPVSTLVGSSFGDGCISPCTRYRWRGRSPSPFVI